MKALPNAQGRFDCRACRAIHGKIPDFASPKERRKHERTFHEQPREGRTKFKRTSNDMQDAGRKWKEDRITELHQTSYKALQTSSEALHVSFEALQEAANLID